QCKMLQNLWAGQKSTEVDKEGFIVDSISN
ncbi:MAG: hypothetical protein K0R55_1681, partial [Sporomusa sp.]|nr:hypothetical protein [Sporomusa sp.]